MGGGTPRRGPRRGWGGLRACTWGCGGSRQVQRLQRSAGRPRRPQRGCPLRRPYSRCPCTGTRCAQALHTGIVSRTLLHRTLRLTECESLAQGHGVRWRPAVFKCPVTGVLPSRGIGVCSPDRRSELPQALGEPSGRPWTQHGGRWAGHGDWELVHRPPTATALLCDDPAPGSQTTLTPGQAELCWARFPADGQGPLALDVSSSRDTGLSGEAGSRLAQAPAQSMCAVPLPV